MTAQSAFADILRTTLQIRGDDVPADAPLGVMVGRRDAPRECIGVLEGGRRSDTDAEMLGGEGNRRRKLQWIIYWDLCSLMDRVIVTSLVDVVIANYICNEYAIEDTLFQRFGKSVQYSKSLYCEDRSRGCAHRPGDWWPTQFMSNALKRNCRTMPFSVVRSAEQCLCTPAAPRAASTELSHSIKSIESIDKSPGLGHLPFRRARQGTPDTTAWQSRSPACAKR